MARSLIQEFAVLTDADDGRQQHLAAHGKRPGGLAFRSYPRGLPVRWTLVVARLWESRADPAVVPWNHGWARPGAVRRDGGFPRPWCLSWRITCRTPEPEPQDSSAGDGIMADPEGAPAPAPPSAVPCRARRGPVSRGSTVGFGSPGTLLRQC